MTKNNASNKGANKSNSVARTKKVTNKINAAAAAVAAGVPTSHDLAVSLAAGAASLAAVPAGRANDVALLMEEDVAYMDLRKRISAHWAAREWSGAAALRASLAAIGTLNEEQILAAVAAAGRKSGEDLGAVTPSLEEVVDYIRTNFAAEFKKVCGCAVPAAAAVRVFSPSALSVGTITADSNINDYFTASAVPAGASASSLVGAVMSVRVLVDIKRRFAAARAAARSNFRNNMAEAARAAGRLGVPAAVAARYFSMLLTAVPAADNKERARLEKNLRGCWAAVRKIENSIVLAAPAGAFGAIEDNEGGWCFPAALPASAPAKVRKLWAKRARVLSSIDTLNALLERC